MQPIKLNEPVYCLTSDVDWASDDCLADLLRLAGEYGIQPTFFFSFRSRR